MTPEWHPLLLPIVKSVFDCRLLGVRIPITIQLQFANENVTNGNRFSKIVLIQYGIKQ